MTDTPDPLRAALAQALTPDRLKQMFKAACDAGSAVPSGEQSDEAYERDVSTAETETLKAEILSLFDYHLRPVLAAPAWQPIETAPKDGTEVLVCDNGDVCVANWEAGPLYTGWRADWHGGIQPTDWLPLPAPPTRGPEEG